MPPEDDEAGGPAPGGRPGSLPHRLWAYLVDGMAAIGTLMIAALMLMISADIVARNGFGGSLPLVSELGALTLVMIVALQLGSTVRHDRLARVEFIVARIERGHPRLHAGLTGLWDLAGAAACAAVAWSSWGILGRDLAHREYIGVTGGATLPVWPFRALILAGIAVAAIQFLIRAIGDFGQAMRAGIRAP